MGEKGRGRLVSFSLPRTCVWFHISLCCDPLLSHKHHNFFTFANEQETLELEPEGIQEILGRVIAMAKEFDNRGASASEVLN